jgi:hypothetical protein
MAPMLGKSKPQEQVRPPRAFACDESIRWSGCYVNFVRWRGCCASINSPSIGPMEGLLRPMEGLSRPMEGLSREFRAYHGDAASVRHAALALLRGSTGRHAAGHSRVNQ